MISDEERKFLECNNMKLYIAVLDEVPDYIVPTLVAHGVLSAHLKFQENEAWQDWLKNSFKKCVVRVNKKEFHKLCCLPAERVHLAHEIHTLNAQKSCAVVVPYRKDETLPNVLKFAKLWQPKADEDGFHVA